MPGCSIHQARVRQAAEVTITAPEALERLRAGNRRFAANRLERSIEYAGPRGVPRDQAPFAVVLGCSDSRVPTEFVFDQGLGELFVIRVAGNVVQSSQIGSVEFAAQKFGVQLVVVLGHTRCGAVEATVDSLSAEGDDGSPNMNAIVDRVRTAIEPLLDTGLDREALLTRGVRANIRFAVRALSRGSTIIESLVDAGKLAVVGAEYVLDTGVVEFFDDPPPETETTS